MHDIGKNIVGVGVGLPRLEVIDLGVIVPAGKILEGGARRRRSTSSGSPGWSRRRSTRWRIGRGEMTHKGFDIPLLIGAATAARGPAVKIAPNYRRR